MSGRGKREGPCKSLADKVLVLTGADAGRGTEKKGRTEGGRKIRNKRVRGLFTNPPVGGGGVGD